MTDIEFIVLVGRMREKQKEYFRTRSKEVLLESKQLEREVDKVLDDWMYNDEQGDLFDGGLANAT